MTIYCHLGFHNEAWPLSQCCHRWKNYCMPSEDFAEHTLSIDYKDSSTISKRTEAERSLYCILLSVTHVTYFAANFVIGALGTLAGTDWSAVIYEKYFWMDNLPVVRIIIRAASYSFSLSFPFFYTNFEVKWERIALHLNFGFFEFCHRTAEIFSFWEVFSTHCIRKKCWSPFRIPLVGNGKIFSLISATSI